MEEMEATGATGLTGAVEATGLTEVAEAAEKAEKEVIRFEMLGSFSYSARKKAGKKTLSFLQYLIMNHARNISTEELIEVFWTENNSSDPANALRNMLFKIRNLLKDMFPRQADLLQTLQGCYGWNPGIRIELDTEQFERLCLEARKCSGNACLAYLRQAVSLYKGDLLMGNDSEWITVPRQYYRTLYLDACKALLPLLETEEEWMEMAAVSSQAYQADPYMEDFTAHLMRAFVAMGQPEQAVDRYEIFRKRILKELGIAPSERIEQLYTFALGLRKEDRGDEREIFRLVCEGNSNKRAFFCSFGMFQSIVALEKRHLARSGQTSTLVIVSIGENAAPSTDARRLERILQDGLRTGDPVARLTAGSYILMLTGTDPENAQIVISRLDCTFHKTYRHSSAQLSFRISALCPETASSDMVRTQ